MACCAPCASSSMGAIGDVLPKVVWPGDVADYVARLDPQMRATNASAHACASLPAATLKAWTDFFDGWGAFKKDASCFFGCANKFDACAQFERELASWQDVLSKANCALVGPAVTSPPDDSAIKWVAGAVIVVALVYAVGPALRRAF